MAAKNNASGGGGSNTLLWMVLMIVMVPVLKTFFADDPLIYMIPNFLMFTPFREHTRAWWKHVLKIDKSVVREPHHIPMIPAKDFNMEALKAATENWRYPAVVKGIFLGSKALEKWPQPGYLKDKIGHLEIPVVNDATYNTMQNDRGVMRFGEAYEEILSDEDSKKYMFFPVRSRFSFNHSELGKLEQVENAINDLVKTELDLNRIFPGFGTHRGYYGSQLIAGRGQATDEKTTGTGWHCALGNNWFIQVAGTKRWYFMDPKYSAMMSPLRGGKVNMQTGVSNMGELQKHIPLRYADIETGDLLWNPDWEWHTIKNFAGLSIGVPLREASIPTSLRNNLQYSLIALTNLILSKVGIEVGGYPN